MKVLKEPQFLTLIAFRKFEDTESTLKYVQKKCLGSDTTW